MLFHLLPLLPLPVLCSMTVHGRIPSRKRPSPHALLTPPRPPSPSLRRTIILSSSRRLSYPRCLPRRMRLRCHESRMRRRDCRSLTSELHFRDSSLRCRLLTKFWAGAPPSPKSLSSISCKTSSSVRAGCPSSRRKRTGTCHPCR
ncbi:hypothetical protein BDQ12DRAFT_315009 [Crucibulum laeve]|uniref:Secreted protein n=1 Tax=Crucibulum laeve TaxID=68775 RepID=A0A5C3M3G8_9AGAR|nr:hypothetical protein BDQ12DRAFT_315009 [Crucibulum laeve]